LGVLTLVCVMRSILCNRSYMLEEAYFTPNFFLTCIISSRAVHNDDLYPHLPGSAIRSVRSCMSCSGVVTWSKIGTQRIVFSSILHNLLFKAIFGQDYPNLGRLCNMLVFSSQVVCQDVLTCNLDTKYDIISIW